MSIPRLASPVRSTHAERVARQALVAVFALVAANALFNLAARVIGFQDPYLMTFLADPSDLFADFFKASFSFPGGHDVAVSGHGPLRDAIRYYADTAMSGGLEALRNPHGFTHLHMPPLGIAMAMTSVAAMRAMDPVLVFGLVNALLAAWLATAVARASGSRNEAETWILTALVSYPAMFLVTRGNWYAGVSGIALIHALLLASRGKPVPAALLLALACNLRPNAILFAVPLFAFNWGTAWMPRLRLAALLGTAGLALLGLSYLLAHSLYPDYTITTFRAGVARYYAGYVVDIYGLAYGSSLFGGLKLLFGYARWEEAAGLAACAAVMIAALTCWMLRRIGRAELVFLVAAAYCVGSTVIADYHLLVFLAPLILWAREAGDEPAGAGLLAMPPMVLGCIAMLAPKNYLFADGISAQVLLNPLLLLACAWLTVSQALPVRRSYPAVASA